jgi:hypothetical protein
MRVIGRGRVLLAADHGAVTTASVYLNAIQGTRPKQPLTPQSPVATAMRVAPSAAAKTPDAQAHAKHTDSRSEKPGEHAPPAARPSNAARLATMARDINRDKRRKTATPAENARRLAQEERARHWAYQQDANGSTFAGRFLGYAD